MSGFIATPTMDDIKRLERRIEALEELVIDEFARIWNCWPSSGRGGAFDYQQFESWRDNIRRSLQQKQAMTEMGHR